MSHGEGSASAHDKKGDPVGRLAEREAEAPPRDSEELRQNEVENPAGELRGRLADDQVHERPWQAIATAVGQREPPECHFRRPVLRRFLTQLEQTSQPEGSVHCR